MGDSKNVSAFAARRTVAAKETLLVSQDVVPRQYSSELEESPSSVEDDGLSSSAASEDENQTSARNGTNTGPPLANKRIFELGRDAIRVELSEDQSIAILGICTVWVRTGEIAVLGARLQASPTLHRIYGPGTLALPQITARSERADFVLASTGDDIRDLHADARWPIWDVPGQPRSAERSFYILGYSFPYDEVLRKRLKVLDLTKWGSVMDPISKSLREGRTVLVCGSGSTGKSTLCRALINRHLTGHTSTPTKSVSKPGVLLADFDLDRPELTPPGLMSLAHVKRPLLGPPESHLAVPRSGQNRILRMHYLGGIDTSAVPTSGIKTITDLLHYCGTVRADFPGCPVLVNSSSWLLDMDSPQLSSLIAMMSLSDIVYFDSSGSLKHREVLTRSMGESCNLCGYTSKVHRSAPASTVQWSYMQSYFHMISSPLDEPIWDRLALLSSNRKDFAYGGSDPMIWAVATLGETLALENVAQALEDSIVSIVAVKMRDSCEAQSNHSLDEIPKQQANHLAPNVPDLFDGQQADHSHIMHTTPENLPYLQELNFEVNILHPQWSECLGLGYITTVDPTRETIELVTPITAERICSQRNNGFRIALVMPRQDRRWSPAPAQGLNVAQNKGRFMTL